jgi:ribosome maturation factor RimP
MCGEVASSATFFFVSVSPSMSKTPQLAKLISIVEPVAVAAGYELVDLRFLLEQGGWVLRVCIDLPLADSGPERERGREERQATSERIDRTQVPSERVDLSDCETMSRELSAVLDVEDPIPQMYSLEVSSPGIDRPLRTAAHFAYFAGSEAKITLGIPMQTPQGERRNFRGILRGVTNGLVAIQIDKDTFHIALDDIDSAKLVPNWDDVMAGKSGVGVPDGPKPVKPGHRPSAKKSKKPSAGADGANGND